MGRIFFAILVCLGCFSMQTMAQPEVSLPVVSATGGDALETVLSKIDIPVLWFSLKDGKDPDYDLISPPEGCMGASITNNEYVEGKMIITRLGDKFYDSGEYVKKESGVRLKVRGNTSANWQGQKTRKPGYKIKLSKKQNILYNWNDAPASKDWVLISCHNTNLNVMAGFELGRVCGLGWQPRGLYVAVVLNGSFKGMYFLSEAVSGEKGRADISDTGYIIEDDPYWWKPGEIYFKSPHLPYSMGWTFKVPDEDDFENLTMPNIDWAVNVLEEAIYSGMLHKEVLDVKTFALWVLAHDIMHTTDAAGSNIFVLKKSFDFLSPFDNPFYMGPLWDFDTCFQDTSDNFSAVHRSGVFYYPQLFTIPSFRDTYIELWRSLYPTLKEELLSRLNALLEANAGIDEARALEYLLNQRYYNDTEECMLTLGNWLAARLEVLDRLIESMSGGESEVSEVMEEQTLTADEEVVTPSGLRVRRGEVKGIYFTRDGKRFITGH